MLMVMHYVLVIADKMQMVQVGQQQIVYSGIVQLQELIVINRPLHKTGHLAVGANLLAMVIGQNQIIQLHQEVYSTSF